MEQEQKTRIELNIELVERADDIYIPIPSKCAYIELAYEEFKNTTLEDLLQEIRKQPTTCTELNRWLTALTLYISYTLQQFEQQ
jgi:hypothetical protein